VINLASDDACYEKARGLAGVELPADDTGSSADMTIIGRIWRHGFADIRYGRPYPSRLQVHCLPGRTGLLGLAAPASRM
jgi:hypothetical protein